MFSVLQREWKFSKFKVQILYINVQGVHGTQSLNKFSKCIPKLQDPTLAFYILLKINLTDTYDWSMLKKKKGLHSNTAFITPLSTFPFHVHSEQSPSLSYGTYITVLYWVRRHLLDPLEVWRMEPTLTMTSGTELSQKALQPNCFSWSKQWKNDYYYTMMIT